MIDMDELIVDSFAGGGGASLGIHLALGRSPDIAINHSESAIAMHAANHPDTRHFSEDVWKVSPRMVTRGQPIGLLWASPDCRHFSRAKGAQPVKKNIRSLAWVVCRWAAEAKPRVIVLENVREFEEWGPLVPRWECRACKWHGTEGQTVVARSRRRCPRCKSLKIAETLEQVPCPKRKGLTFRRFISRLRKLGYAVEWRALNAADFGAPTHRRRLFLIVRRDGEPIVWPEATHGDPKKLDDSPLFGEPLKPWRTAAECIDWSIIPCPSIFDRKKPLAEATLRRIAMGIKRYVLDSPKPFIVPVTHHGERRTNSIDEPLPTVTGAHRGEHALITPYLVGAGGAAYAGKPKPVIEAPLPTATSNNHAALVYSFLTKYSGTAIGQLLNDPLGTATSKDRFGVVVVHIDGEPYVIADIGMRMLSPRELARAQGFPDSYVLTGTKTNQVHKIGNSVSPPVARAIVEANFVMAPATVS